MKITTQHKDKASEIAYATGKGLIASIPFVGGIAAELLGVAIPNKRMERVEQMVTQFAEKVKDIETEVLHKRMREPSFEELFEQGCYVAANNIAKDKLEAIANILAYGARTNEHTNFLAYALDAYARLETIDLALVIHLMNHLRERNESNNHLDKYAVHRDELFKITAKLMNFPFVNEKLSDDNSVLCHSVTDSSVSRLISSNWIVKVHGEDSDEWNNYFVYISAPGIVLIDYIETGEN